MLKNHVSFHKNLFQSNLFKNTVPRETTIKNASSIKLEKQLLSDVVDTIRIPNQKLTINKIKTEQSKSTEFDKYFSSFFENLEGISKVEKEYLSELVKEALRQNDDYFSKGWTSDIESMYHLQTKEKLNLIAKNIPHSSVKNEFLAVVQDYTSAKLEQTVNKSLETYEIIYNQHKEKKGPYRNIADRMLDAINNIQEGKHFVQNEQNLYSHLFLKSNVISFQHKYEEVMKGYKQIQKNQFGESWNEFSEMKVDDTIRMLKENWNNFVNQFEAFSAYRLSSNTHYNVDMKI
ncbi:hypothetical protein [Virgibacillus dokdonensis]|uniref:Uncharacterized protein n=1 Tax=Virgibacillus dokdonensis TaxID=302167 RepID=A0A2K9IWK4_9BACI|nr:hypothetical protein [Virgibacillus dokdonensis]AUJ24146.1 hypothetical protein A21D_01034 [Virgibacillus dokdonensis]